MSYITADSAQSAEAFLIAQASYIEREVYKIQYPAIRYKALVPLDTSAHPWAPSVTFFSLDQVGQASWFNGRADDVPLANIVRAKYETPIEMGAIGYEFDMEELQQAQLLGRNLTADKADAAQFAAEKFIDNVAILGDPNVNYTGLINNPYVTVTTAAPTGTGSATQWSTKTTDQMLVDVNGILSGIWTGSNTVELADTLLMPLANWQIANDTRFDQIGITTLIEFLRTKNIYTAETGQPLTIKPVRGLDTAGAGGTARMVAYRRDPSVVKMHVPMPFQFVAGAPWRRGPMKWHVPGIFRVGGVDFRRPGAARYMDGV